VCSCRYRRYYVGLLLAAVGITGIMKSYCVQLWVRQVSCRPSVCSCSYSGSYVGLLCAAVGKEGIM
jgi:hypothetical protein